MEALLQIRIRINARESMSDLRMVEQELAKIDAMGAKAAKGGMNSFFGMMSKGADHMTKFGKNLQWAGRQLEFSFTLPLAIAGGMATKWALDSEAAMTRVRKVYGDGTESADQLDGELKALMTTFTLLSDRFGVNRAEVIATAEAWAQAGSAGVGLAKNVQNTMQFAIVSGMDLQKSTEALIATQAIFGYTSEEMAQQLAYLNSIENQTAVDMPGLIDVLQRAGGAARGVGIDIRHLGAFTAALVPAAGTASKAGNSLRTIISRIFAPTKQAKEAMAALGIDVESTSWLMKNGAERIEELATKTEGLTQNQEALIASTFGSRYQFNQFMVLMRDVANAQGNYAKALKACGLDYIDVSSGGINADTRNPTEPGYNVPIAERIKREAGVATRVVGLITTPGQAEAIVAGGKADMVALARGLLDDPRWGWHAAIMLGAEVSRVPQYQRAAPKLWAPAAQRRA